MSITSAEPKETRPLLPTTSVESWEGKPEDRPHALLGMTCVALSAVCFSLMSTLLKYNTFSMTSIEAIFWRSVVGISLNYVRLWLSPRCWWL
jgi:hypothetical protein